MEKKTFKSIDEVVQYLENQMIIATLKDYQKQQLDYIDQAVLQSDLTEAKQVIQHIMEKK